MTGYATIEEARAAEAAGHHVPRDLSHVRRGARLWQVPPDRWAVSPREVIVTNDATPTDARDLVTVRDGRPGAGEWMTEAWLLHATREGAVEVGRDMRLWWRRSKPLLTGAAR